MSVCAIKALVGLGFLTTCAAFAATNEVVSGPAPAATAPNAIVRPPPRTEPYVVSSANEIVSLEALTLDKSIDMAVHRNPQVRKAREEIHRRYGVLLEARSGFIPQLRGTSSLTKREPQTTEFFGSTQSFLSQLRLTQILWTGGQVYGATRSAIFGREAAILGFDRIVADTIVAVRTQFYQVLFNRQLIQVREASVKLLEEQLENTKRRFEAGTVPRFDVLRAEVELANARPPLIQANNNYRIAIIKLANLLALDPPKPGADPFPFVIVGELLYDLYEVDLDESLGIAKQRRSELRELEKTVAARREEVRIAHGGYHPQIEVYGQYEARNPSIGESKSVTTTNGTFQVSREERYTDLDPEIRGFSAGVQLSWDIFDGFATHGRVVQARAAWQAAKLDLEQKQRDIEVEVREANSRLQEARETIESQKKVLEQGEESLRLAQARFKVGAGTQLDVLSAQTALTDARTTYAEALYNWNVAVANVERATGLNTRVANLDELRRD